MAPIATLTVRLSAQIAEFQQEFREATKVAQTFQQQFAGVAGRVGALASGITAGIGVIGITNFVRGLTEAAGKTVDLSNQLGISIGAVQRLNFVAGQTGTTVDAFANAIHRLGINLAGGDKGAVASVEKLGLSFSQLRQLKPEEQFERLADALGNVADPQERARLAQELFGRQAKEILPAIAEGYSKLAREAKAAGDEQVKAVDKAGDAAKRAQEQFKNLGVQGFGNIVLGAEAAEKKLFSLADFLNRGLRLQSGVFGDIARYNAHLNDTEAAARAAAAAVQSIKAPKIPTQPGFWPVGAETPGLPSGAAGGLGFEELLAISDGLKRSNDAFQKAKKAADEYADSVKRLRDQISGAALQREVKLLSDAFSGLSTSQRQAADVLDRVGTAAEELRRRGASLTPQLKILADQSEAFVAAKRREAEALLEADRILVETRRSTNDAKIAQEQLLRPLRESGQAWIDNAKATAELDASLAVLVQNQAKTGGWFATVPTQANQVTAAVKGTRVEFGELARALAQLAQVSGSGFLGTLVQSLSTLVTAVDTAQKSMDQFKAGLSALKGGSLLAGLSGVATGILGIASAAIAAGKALAGLFDRNKGRDLVVDFAATFDTSEIGTGFDELHRKLQDTFDPATAERYWIALTQGVGRNNPEQAKKIIDEINAALGRQTDRMAGATAILAEYGLTWEDAGEKFKNANIAAQFDALFEKTATLKDIGVDYTVILEKQASEYSNLLQAALRTGSEIPIAFKPILDDLLLAGKLLREDGTAFDDLGDVSWSKTLTQGFKDVTTAIYDLRDALVGGVGGALDDLSRRRITIPVGFDVDEIVLPDANIPQLAKGGIVRRPTLAIIGEAGPEAVVPLSQLGGVQAGFSKITTEPIESSFGSLIDARTLTATNRSLETIAAQFTATTLSGEADFERLNQSIGVSVGRLVRETNDVIGSIASFSLNPVVTVTADTTPATDAMAELKPPIGVFTVDADTAPALGALSELEAQSVSDSVFTVYSDTRPALSALVDLKEQRIADGLFTVHADTAPAVNALSDLVNRQPLDAAFAVHADTAPAARALADLKTQQVSDGAFTVNADTTLAKDSLDRFTLDSRLAFQTIADEFESIIGRVKGSPINIPVLWEIENFPVRIPDVTTQMEFDGPQLARGGIVRKPTLALIGEAGPEAVVPLSHMGTAQPVSSTVIFEMDGRTVAEVVVPHLPGAVRRRVHA